MEPIQCFLLEATTLIDRSLRRFVSGASSDRNNCPLAYGYHNAEVFIDRVEATVEALHAGPESEKGNPLWPILCGCGYEFGPEDDYQIFTARVMRRADTGELMTWREAPAGAMRFADWLIEGGKRNPYWHAGADGHCLMVKCPPDGWEWAVDGRASNCTMPSDNEHDCWVRHGEAPRVTVDKAGRTCAAGAGSIQTPRWHGFLRDGFLITA